MKTRPTTLLATIALLTFSLAAFGASFRGVIMDSSCAKMGSHYQMEKAHPKMFKDPNHALTGAEARACTLACVKMGAHLALYNPTTKNIYKLDPASDAEAYAGERVKVTGTLSGTTIHVTKVSKH